MPALFKKFITPLFLIFFLGLFLRTWDLQSIPVGLHGDEASIGYNAFSLLKTAKDQDGNFLPLAFDQFGNFRAGGYQYIDIPFVALLGLNALAVRLPAAIFGSLSIIVFYLFLLEFFNKKPLALTGAFLLAILPWHINISRASSEGIISSFFVLLGIYIFYRSIKRNNFSMRLLFAGIISFLISFFFYHASGFFAVLFLPLLFIFSFLSHPDSRKKIRLTSLLYVFIVLGFILFLTAGKGTGRVSQVGLLNVPGGTKEVSDAGNEDRVQNPLLTRFYHNKLYFYGRLFTSFYSQHLSPDFLFVNNGNPIRYRIPWTGNLYLIQAPFLLLGFVFLLYEGLKLKKYLYLIPVFWLFIGVLPAALTWEDLPNVLRSNLMIPALLIITVFGFFEFLILVGKKLKTFIIVLASLFLLQNAVLFLHNYFYHAKAHEPWYRSAAEEDLVFTANDLSKRYSEVVMTTERNNNLIFHLFYLKFDPLTFQKMGSPKETHNLKFGKLVFKYNLCPLFDYPLEKTDLLKDKVFIMHSGECKIPRNWSITKTIYTPDGSPAFIVVEMDRN